MQIIKVDAIESTNTYLRDLVRKKSLDTSVCVSATEQLKGKGQMGTTWQSNRGENLTTSVFMPISGLKLSDQFYISICAALAVCDTLQGFFVPKISIKWPNDILSEKLKICGILIENIVINGSLTGAIIGVGLNVNQTKFIDLPQAGSLKMSLGRHFDLDEVLQNLLYNIQKSFDTLCKINFEMLKNSYEDLIFRKNKPSTFKDAKGESFVGIIQNVAKDGKLQVLLEDEVIKSFDLKEIQLLY